MIKKLAVLCLIVLMLPSVANAACHCKGRINKLKAKVVALEARVAAIEPKLEYGAVTFSVNEISSGEGRYNINVDVVRVGGKFGVAEVSVVATDGTATGGVGGPEYDYYLYPNPRIVKWNDNQLGAKAFNVDFAWDDDIVEGPENFFLTLTNPVGGIELGEITQIEVTIVDND